MDREKILEECRKKCTCPNYKSSFGKNISKISKSSQDAQDASQPEQLITFVAFITDMICFIAFIIFGAVILWLSLSGVLFEYLKKLYYSNRNIKIAMACLFSILILSMSVRFFLNRRACRSQVVEIQNDANENTEQGSPPKPPPEYIDVVFKDKKLRHHYKGGEEDRDKYINKTLTLTISNEKNEQVFKTSKLFFIPEMAMEMKQPPVVLVYLKEIILDNY